jgi:superfamily II DNA or RNA helicase
MTDDEIGFSGHPFPPVPNGLRHSHPFPESSVPSRFPPKAGTDDDVRERIRTGTDAGTDEEIPAGRVDHLGSQSSVDQPRRAPTLRAYQHACIHGGDARGPGILPALEQHHSALVVIATGGGKSVIAGALSQHEVARGGRVLMLAHREELVEQLAAKARAAGVEVEIEQGPRRAGDASVVVGSVPTLARSKRLLEWPQDAFSRVIADECHHAPAASWSAILGHFHAAKVVGFTATPDRADGVALGKLFATVAYRLEIRELIAMGYLVPIRARRVVLEGVDLSRLAIRRGDFAQDELAAAMATERAVAGAVTALREMAAARSTIVFAASVDHARKIAAELRRRAGSGCAHVVHGELPRDERRILMRTFAAGEYQYLVNVDVATEGVDIPRASCVAMLRPTKSRSRYVQGAGRGLRLLGDTYAESCAAGKSDMLLLDFSGTAGKHRLVGPVDVLDGDAPDELRAELDGLLGVGTGPLEEMLDAAASVVEIRRTREAAAAKVRWFTEHIDVFIGEQAEISATRSGPIVAAPSPAQLAALADLGIEPARLPMGFTANDASRLIGRLHARTRAGLCSLKQARRLGSYGLDTRTMTSARATELMVLLIRNRWSSTSLIGQPEAGEEFHRRMAAAHAAKLAKRNKPAASPDAHEHHSGDVGEGGSGQTSPHATQQGAATPGNVATAQGADAAAGNVSERQFGPTPDRAERPDVSIFSDDEYTSTATGIESE